MKRIVIIFEDHTAVRFRPLAWGTPVYDMGWGMFNLRERVAAAAKRRDAQVVLLPRGILEQLQLECLPAGMRCGAAACRDALDRADRAVMLSSRLRGDSADLDRLLADDAPDGVWNDRDGATAAVLPASRAGDLIASWAEWDRAVDEQGAWVRHDASPDAWQPDWPVAPAADRGPRAWRALWERVGEIGEALAADAARVAVDGAVPGRTLFGAVPDPDIAAPLWTHPAPLAAVGAEGRDLPEGVFRRGDRPVLLGEDVDLAAGCVLDATGGPIIIESGSAVGANAVLQGPLWLGTGVRIKPGTLLAGEVAAAAACRLSGEIAETQIAALSNKQHYGFLGHALLGSWVNLGAGTTNSDLKNNYGEIRVDLGGGEEPTGCRFLGAMIGDHVKTAIGTLFNTGSVVGFASNVFATGFPGKFTPCFMWGDGGAGRHDPERALATAEVAMRRRGCVLTEAHRELFLRLAGGSR